MNTNSLLVGKFLLLPAALVFLLLAGCDSTTEVDDPGFSNLTSLAGKTFTSYLSFSYDSDTVISLSFDYQADNAGALDVKGTLDSGAAWIPITTIPAASSNSATVLWSPMQSTTADFDYFGHKEAFIRITDPASGKHVDSEVFNIIGRTPFKLTSPLGGESYNIADTVKVYYSGNTDLISRIQVFFKTTTTMADWLQVTGTEALDSPDIAIKNQLTAFVPQDYTTEAGNFSEPIKILLADYGFGSDPIESGYITILP